MDAFLIVIGLLGIFGIVGLIEAAEQYQVRSLVKETDELVRAIDSTPSKTLLITEGKTRKGGVNDSPTRPRPSSPPPAMSVKKS